MKNYFWKKWVTLTLFILKHANQKYNVHKVLDMSEEDINDLHYLKDIVIKGEKGANDVVTTIIVDSERAEKGMIKRLQDYRTYKDQKDEHFNKYWTNIDPDEFERFRVHALVSVSNPAPSRLIPPDQSGKQNTNNNNSIVYDFKESMNREIMLLKCSKMINS